jgi:transcriptional regulator with XRE-family HTH domain
MHLRQSAGLSQIQLAHQSQVALGTIQGLEQGVRADPRLSTIIKVLQALKRPSTDLIEKANLVEKDRAWSPVSKKLLAQSDHETRLIDTTNHFFWSSKSAKISWGYRMSWDCKGKYRYYSRSKKVNGKIIREYVGGGAVGEMAETLDALRRAERQATIKARRAEEAAHEKDLASLLDLCQGAYLLFRCSLVTAGYTRSGRGEWRKQPNVRTR